jgi:hypothetical protein
MKIIGCNTDENILALMLGRNMLHVGFGIAGSATVVVILLILSQR